MQTFFGSRQMYLHQVSDVHLPACSTARVGAPVIAMTGMRSAYEPAIPLTDRLFFTSDAADEQRSVEMGSGQRDEKKKQKSQRSETTIR
ncbi:hypothetical protein G6X34_08465 [Staphylococcus aureus]|nr:hypothetical protein [Staphylococcus aureus]